MIDEDYGRLPAYWRVEKHLTDVIKKLKPGDILPSEKELVEKYQLSRTTIRTALSNLVAKGVIVRKPGRGTFVTERTITESLAFLNSFTSEMEAINAVARSKVLCQQIELANETLTEAFGVPLGTEVLRLERIRYMGDIPVALQRSFINLSLDRKLDCLIKEDFNRNSLYETLERLGFSPNSAEEEIRIAVLDRNMRNLLMSEDTHGLSRSRKTYLLDGRCIESVNSVYRGDNYTLKLSLRRKGNSDVGGY
ncbi:MAG TPA: GntR family transcriptional regulator [Mesotoga infera]|nr:GntR family transcriptional regulator [Mesotoga infera]